jgi:hypothetical protein
MKMIGHHDITTDHPARGFPPAFRQQSDPIRMSKNAFAAFRAYCQEHNRCLIKAFDGRKVNRVFPMKLRHSPRLATINAGGKRAVASFGKARHRQRGALQIAESAAGPSFRERYLQIELEMERLRQLGIFPGRFMKVEIVYT